MRNQLVATVYWNELWHEVGQLVKAGVITGKYPEITRSKQELTTFNQQSSAIVNIPVFEFIKANNDDITQVDFDFLMEERASILEYETCIPYAWSLAIVSLRAKKRPLMMSIEKWRTVKKVMQQLCDQEYLLLNRIIVQSWAISDIFGCDKSIPEKSFYNMGLVMLLNAQDKIINIDSSVITIENSKNVVSSYRRLYANTKINQVLIHELT